MSLINQMLQDLEQRSSGNLTGTGLHREVRAAPDRNRIHPAWLLVVVLSMLLIGVLLWLWLRPTPVAPTNQQLALKIAPDLAALPSPVAQAPLPMDTDNQNSAGNTATTNNHPEGPPQADIKPLPVTQSEGKAVTAPTAVADVSEPKSQRAQIAATTTMPLTTASTIDDTKPARHGKEAMPRPSESNDVATTVNLTKQIKELTPQQQAENDYRQAVTVLQQGHTADAMTDLEQALKLDPSNAGARQMLVGLLLQVKRNDEAIQRTQEGLAIDPSQVGLTMILARVQVEQNDQKAALATLERGMPYANANADYQAFYAAVLQREKRNKEAVDHYAVALAKSPDNSVWWMGLGISLQAENRLPEAKEAYNRAKSTNGLTPDLVAFVNQKLSQLR